MQLEPAKLADVPALVALMNDAFRGEGPDASWCSEADLIAGDRVGAADLAADIAARPGAMLLHRDDTGELLGCVWLEDRGQGVWYLGSLAIATRQQNGGGGRRLLAAAEDRARTRGGRVIRMRVVNHRDTLIAWYLRRGYHLTGETEPFPYDDPRLGTPRRADLSFVVLEKPLQTVMTISP